MGHPAVLHTISEPDVLAKLLNDRVQTVLQLIEKEKAGKALSWLLLLFLCCIICVRVARGVIKM